MQCVNCKNLGKLVDENGEPYDWCEAVCDNPDIHMERTCRHFNRATIGDRVRNMTNKELAEFLCYTVSPSGTVNCSTCGAAEFCRMGHNGWHDWLEQEVTE